MRPLAALLVLVLAGVPLLQMPSRLVAGFAVVAAAVCAAGVATLSVPLVTAGASLALLEYTVALWQSGRPPDVIAGVGIGLSLLLLLQVVDFAHRVAGCEARH